MAYSYFPLFAQTPKHHLILIFVYNLFLTNILQLASQGNTITEIFST